MITARRRCHEETAGYAFVVTFIILKVLNRFESVRVPDSMEEMGLDTELEERQAYVLS